MFENLARVITQYPRRILAFWILVLGLCIPLARQVDSILTTEGDVVPDSRAERVRQLIHENFSTQDDTQILLVVTLDEGDDPQQAGDAFFRTLERIAALPAIKGVRDPRTDPLLPTFDNEARAALSLITLDTDSGQDPMDVLETIDGVLPNGVGTYILTGGPAFEREALAISQRDIRRAELLGLPLSVIVLIYVFGAVVAATLPLLVALTSITISFAMLFLLGQQMPVATFSQVVVTMLGLATGIDYALLMVNRFREELAAGHGPKRAAFITSLTAGRAVVFSGLTVLLALTALLIPPLASVRSLGIASIATLTVSVGVTITTMPAILTLLGHNVNRLRVTRKVPGTRSRRFWQRWAREVLRRPWAWVVAGALVVVGLTLPALRMEIAYPAERGLTADTDIREAQQVLESLGLTSLLRSFEILVDFGDRGFYHPSSVLAMQRLTRQTREVEGVEQILSPTTVDSVPPLLLRQYYATPETAAASPFAALAKTTVSQNGRYALLQIFPAAFQTGAERRTVATNLEQAIDGLGLDALIGGAYVVEREWLAALYRSFPVALALVYLATFLLLGFAFQSLLIPLKSIILNTLTVGVAFGVITLVFQDGVLTSLFGLSSGLGFVDFSAPLFIFAIVFGLSMDYEVFLLARVFEEHQRGRNDHDAIRIALAATGGVITSAALIMVVVFSMFLFSDIVLIKTLALGLTVAVLLDATLVRSVLVPAVMVLMGTWNWKLPRLVKRLVSRVRISHD